MMDDEFCIVSAYTYDEFCIQYTGCTVLTIVMVLKMYLEVNCNSSFDYSMKPKQVVVIYLDLSTMYTLYSTFKSTFKINGSEKTP